MRLPDASGLTAQAAAFMEGLHRSLSSLPDMAISAFPPSSTALFVVDMVGGFAREGALASPRAGALAAPIARLTAQCLRAGMPVVAFADTHSPDSIELQSYPPHCLRGTAEAALCPEIAAVLAEAPADAVSLIEKNSTNGFLEPVFELWRREHAEVDTYIVVGDCTDICVQQFVLTAKAWHNARDLPLRLAVPLSLVDTFDGPDHPADVLGAAALYFMRAAGAELYASFID